MPRRLAAIVIVCFATLSASSRDADAQQPTAADQQQQPLPSQPTLTQSATDTFDTVHLRNGGLFRGRVTEIVPDDHVLMVTEAGETKRFGWAEIARIITSTVPPPPTQPPPVKPPPPSAPSTPPFVDAHPAPGPPETQWRANRPLLVTGAILFAAGYGPNAIAAAPSTLGLIGRAVVLILTLGLPCIFNGGGYICKGDHGALQLLIPFAGPVLFANNHPQDSVLNESGSQLPDAAKALLITSAVVQIAGVSSIFGALIFGGQEPVPQRKTSSSGGGTGAFDILPRIGKNGPPMTIAPLSAPNAVGVSVGIHNW